MSNTQRLTAEKTRYWELSRKVPFLKKQMPQKSTSGRGQRYQVIIYEGDYYGRGDNSSVTLIGVYNTAEAAYFIAHCVKQQRKLGFLPKVEQTNNGVYPETADNVDLHLETLREEFSNLAKKLRTNQ